jgi:methylated-DNA-protein-cysteine methyltransferase-like protein
MPRGQNLYFRIYTIVRRIPKGTVASYGQVATLAGNPRASRVVGWALRTLKPTTNVPWHRVINKAGMISIENMHVPKDFQAMKLREEGVEVVDRDGNLFVDMDRFGWRP